ncbi:MAG: hypothetical protein CM15mP95_2950 [Alphaproteobacteria bacterium]|nr:MAG: hypothetical protein CM15mP95_2950 [Alphaproteobacteria bacterium]
MPPILIVINIVVAWRDDIGGIQSSAKLLAGMHQVAVSAGAQIFTGVAVSSIPHRGWGRCALLFGPQKGQIAGSDHAPNAKRGNPGWGAGWAVISEMIGPRSLGKNRVGAYAKKKALYETPKFGSLFPPSPEEKRILRGQADGF